MGAVVAHEKGKQIRVAKHVGGFEVELGQKTSDPACVLKSE